MYSKCCNQANEFIIHVHVQDTNTGFNGIDTFSQIFVPPINNALRHMYMYIHCIVTVLVRYSNSYTLITCTTTG